MGPGPSPVAPRGRLFPPGAAERLPSRRPRCDRADRTACTLGAGTHRPGAVAGLALSGPGPSASPPAPGEGAHAPIQDMRGTAQGRLGKAQRYRQLIARGKNAHQVVVAIARELRACMWAMAQEVPLTPETETVARPQSLARGLPRPAEETPPRLSATLDGVKRRKETLVPRARPALDGRAEGGSQPTDIRRITRRILLAPALPRDEVQ